MVEVLIHFIVLKNKIAEIKNESLVYVYDLSQFDISAIMHSGQVFRYWEREDGSFDLVVGSEFARISHLEIKEQRDKNEQSSKQEDDRVKICEICCSNANFFWRYFDLDTDYRLIKNKLVESDRRIEPMIIDGGGIRILHGGFVEMVISFIISANNNIKRFTKTLNSLSEKYGTKLGCVRDIAGENMSCDTHTTCKTGENVSSIEDLYAFPTLKQLLCVAEEQFRELGCGYRRGYLVDAVSQLKNMSRGGEDGFEWLYDLPDEDLYAELIKIKGVGDKVARCVMLFAFHRLGIAPVDTWMERAVERFISKKDLYGGEGVLNGSEKNKRITPRRMAQLFEGKFAPYSGVAQQYLFYYWQYLGKGEK